MKLLGRLLAWPLALLILFEEWGWDPLRRLGARVVTWLRLQRLEALIRALPPYAALALFVLPTLALLPVKLLALWLIAQGRVVLGAAVILGAKLIGTALLAWLFSLTREALLRLTWFARLYGSWTAFKERLLAHVRASWPWRWARVLKRRVLRGRR